MMTWIVATVQRQALRVILDVESVGTTYQYSNVKRVSKRGTMTFVDEAMRESSARKKETMTEAMDATEGLIKLLVGVADAAATAEASKDVVPREHTGTPTEIILKEMLLENTGVSILDSGSAYGRNWQLNQIRNFDAQPAASIKFGVYNGKPDITVSLDTYHFLKDRLEIATELDTIFHGRFLKERDADGSKYWTELMEEFPEYLAELRENDGISDSGEELETKNESDDSRDVVLGNNVTGLVVIHHESESDESDESNESDEAEEPEGDLRFGEFGGIYGEGEPLTVNTYNGENLVDQILQYVLFSNDSGEYVALQIHGGCDVRGGYTKPRVFSFGHRSELDIIDNMRATIHCTGKDRLPEAERFFEKIRAQLALPGIGEDTRAALLELENSNEHHWDTDDAYHWYFQGSCGAGAEPQLEKYEAVNLDDEEHEFKVQDKEGPGIVSEFWEPGKLCIKDGDGYCPYCGAKLSVSA